MEIIIQQKILSLLNELNSGLVEREATLKTALLTVLAGENLVLIGPPGTGKSLIARRIAECFAYKNNNSYFEYLLTKFSTPEEIFWPLSISELKADHFKRNTAGYLPSVNMAFLDEIFKASSSILNALLTILNERLYHNGAVAEKVPLQALIAASNELPTDQEELNALYDRFLVRSFVDYVSNDNPILQTHITAAELAHIKHAVQAVIISPEIAAAIQSIWMQHKETFKEDRREYLSDRRLKKVLHLLRVSAVTNGRSEVDLSDVLLLKDCLWNHQGNALKVRELILKTLQRYSTTWISVLHKKRGELINILYKVLAQKIEQLYVRKEGYKSWDDFKNHPVLRAVVLGAKTAASVKPKYPTSRRYGGFTKPTNTG